MISNRVLQTVSLVSRLDSRILIRLGGLRYVTAMLLRRWAWLILSNPVTSSRIRPVMTKLSNWRPFFQWRCMLLRCQPSLPPVVIIQSVGLQGCGVLDCWLSQKIITDWPLGNSCGNNFQCVINTWAHVTALNMSNIGPGTKPFHEPMFTQICHIRVQLGLKELI